MNRQYFVKQQIKDHPFKPEILSPVPSWVTLGKNVHIAENVTFAAHGFGYEEINGKWELIPHSGGVMIQSNVHIHEGTVIVRATASEKNTIICNGTKIDTLCHIAHNVFIGKNCLITSGCIIGGSTVIGNNCYLGIGSLIRNKIILGNYTTIGMGAVVISSNEIVGLTLVGNPAKIKM